MVVLLGVAKGDSIDDARYLARRTAGLRIFNDAEGMMNHDVRESGGSALIVSQFTLYADTRKGNRPSYITAAPSEEAEPIYDAYVAALRESLGTDRVHTGVFRATMVVEILNDGPVTIMIESK